MTTSIKNSTKRRPMRELFRLGTAETGVVECGGFGHIVTTGHPSAAKAPRERRKAVRNAGARLVTT